MAIDPQLLDMVLHTPESQDVTESPIVRAVILSDPTNAADLVPSLEAAGTLATINARQILSLFEPNAVAPLLAALPMAGPHARMEGLEAIWALLAGEPPYAIRDALIAAKPDLEVLLADKRPLPDDMPGYVERDFRGRVCDLAYVVVRQLLEPEFDQSTFRASDDRERDDDITRLLRTGLGVRIV